MKNTLTIHSDVSESLHYNYDNFPLYAHMDFYVNGQIIRIHEGEALFINSQRLHYGFSNKHNECTFIALVISPDIFINTSAAAQEYMHHKFGLKNNDYVLLSPDISSQNIIIKAIKNVYELMQNFSRPLLIISKSIEILDMIGEHIDDHQNNSLDSYDQDLFLLIQNIILKVSQLILYVK